MEIYNTEDSILANIGGQAQLLVAAFNASISGIIITDFQLPDNPIIYCNPAFEAMTGYQRDEILGKNCRFLQGEDREQVGRYKIQEALAEAGECHVEIANYRKDGSIFYNELYIAPVKDSKGTVTHYIGIQNDITIRKQQEASIRLELANAQKLQQLKEEFLTTASHELKTPITSLKGTLQLMKRFFPEEQIDSSRFELLLNNAERQTVKLTHLVQDLISSTRLINGELPLNKTRFQFDEVFDGCCSHITLNGTHQIRKSGNAQLEVYADQHKINQVMVNLLDNAVKYSPSNEEILIKVVKLEQQIIVTVTDKGCGIAEEDKPRLFERYYKATVGNGMQNMGLGLGLYIAAEIVRRHGGEIGVESEVGSGSSFWFCLPA
jgi:PAS domain S-box-containing protein